MTKKHTGVICVKEPDWFRVYENYCGLQAYYRDVACSRRNVPVMIHRDIFGFKGEILLPDGRVWPKPYCIHTVFDPENRWHTNFLKIDEDGRPVYQSYIVPRLQIYWLGRELGTFEAP